MAFSYKDVAKGGRKRMEPKAMSLMSSSKADSFLSFFNKLLLENEKLFIQLFKLNNNMFTFFSQ